MQTHIGSIQRKGRRYYLVVTVDSKQRWMALRTDRKAVARKRAALLAPKNPDNYESWLLRLVNLGEAARDELHRQRLTCHLSWENLWHRFESVSAAQLPVASRPSYARWIRLLADAISSLHLNIPSPVQMSHDIARQVASFLGKRYISANRMFVFYNRVWRTLALRHDVWKDVRVPHCNVVEKSKEYYRRLSVSEVKKLVDYLDTSNRRDYADMVVIGFYTGLRLSDVAELELDEISPDQMFLHVLPNKVRHSKNHILTIPLIYGARARVMRRVNQLKTTSLPGGNKKLFLFPKSARRHPSRPLSVAFHTCGIVKCGNGRASFHSLRATFISLMDEAGIPPHITDAITGHAAGGMHARYTQPTPAALLDAVLRALPRLDEIVAVTS